MTEVLLTRVKTKLFLRSRQRATHLLEGEYASLFPGRSMDFADLREYVHGDEIADIDWNASARTGSTLVRQWAAERRNRVCLVVDAGRGMAATSTGGDDKRAIATTVAGALGYIALRHGDEVGMITGTDRGIRQLPFRSTEAALERALRVARDTTTVKGGHSDVLALLQRARVTLKKRMFVVVVTDEVPLTDAVVRSLRALAAVHELVWVEVGDANPVAPGRAVFDVDERWQVPGVLQNSPRLKRDLAAADARRAQQLAAELERQGISHTRIERVDDAVPKLLELLRTRHAVRT